MAAGEHFLDVIVRQDGKVDNIGLFAIRVDSALGGITFRTDKERYQRGEEIKFDLSFEKPTPLALGVKALLRDSPNADIWSESSFAIAAGQNSISGSVTVRHMPAWAGYLDYQILKDGKVIAEGHKPLLFPKHELPVYYSYVWDGVRDWQPLTARRLRDDAGFDAVLNGGDVDGYAQLNMGFVAYCRRLGIGNDEKNGTKVSGNDAKQLADQSFSNPEVRSKLDEAFRKWVEKNHALGIQVYSLGDENYLSYDAGFTPSDETAFRLFLKERHGSIDNLNREWGASYSSFEQAEHLHPQEALSRKMYPAWMAHRAFMEKMYADLHHFHSKIVKEYDPKAIVGAEGSVPGDLEKTIQGLEFWGPYSDPVGNELLRSIGPEKLRTLWWGGYVGSHGGRSGLPMPLWAPLLTGAVNGSAWFCGYPCSEGMMTPDLDFAKYFKELLPHLMSLKNGMAQLLINAPLSNDGVAIYWSHESDSASLIATQYHTPKDSISAFIQFCYANGIQFQFLTPSALERGELADKKLLFLFGASSVNGKSRDAIQAFAERGGVVVADINPGVMNEFCRPSEGSCLEALFGVSGLKAELPPATKEIRIDQEARGRRIRFEAMGALSAPEAGIFHVNPVGKGLALLLNFNLGAAEQTASAQTPFDRFMLDLLSLADITPKAKVEGLNPAHVILRVRQAEGYAVVGLLDSTKADLNKTATLAWNRKVHVYEADKGYVGHLDQWKAEMKVPFKIYCLFEQERQPPPIKLSAATAAPGTPLALDLTPFAKDTVLRLELPGLNRPEVLVIDGKRESHELWFAYNYPPGAHRIVLTDVRTGLKSEQEFNLVVKP